MLIPSAAWAALLEAGVTVRPVSAREVELSTTDGGSVLATASVRRLVVPLSPSHLRQHLAAASGHRGELLLVVPAASPAALEAAAAAGISVIVANERGHEPVIGRVLLPGAEIVIGADRSPADGERRARPGRRPWGALAVVRQLLRGPLTSQVELATRAGVSQGRVSQALSRLTGEGLVRRTTSEGRPRWTVTDWDALAHWWLRNYPGPGGLTTYWYGLTSPVEQARTVVAALRAIDVPVVVSGDVAADVLAPWRRPGRAVIYADVSGHPTAADLTAVGLTPSGPEEATLELVVPADHGVWPAKDETPATADLPLADGLQILWDLRRAPGSDVDQAIATLQPVLQARAQVPAEAAG